MLKKKRKGKERREKKKIKKRKKGGGAGGSSIKDRDLHSAEYCLGFVGFIVGARLNQSGGHILGLDMVLGESKVH